MNNKRKPTYEELEVLVQKYKQHFWTENRKFRAATTAHVAAALVRAFAEPDPNARLIAWRAVSIADAVMERLAETDLYRE